MAVCRELFVWLWETARARVIGVYRTDIVARRSNRLEYHCYVTTAYTPTNAPDNERHNRKFNEVIELTFPISIRSSQPCPCG